MDDKKNTTLLSQNHKIYPDGRVPSFGRQRSRQNTGVEVSPIQATVSFCFCFCYETRLGEAFEVSPGHPKTIQNTTCLGMLDIAGILLRCHRILTSDGAARQELHSYVLKPSWKHQMAVGQKLVCLCSFPKAQKRMDFLKEQIIREAWQCRLQEFCRVSRVSWKQRGIPCGHFELGLWVVFDILEEMDWFLHVLTGCFYLFECSFWQIQVIFAPRCGFVMKALPVWPCRFQPRGLPKEAPRKHAELLTQMRDKAVDENVWSTKQVRTPSGWSYDLPFWLCAAPASHGKNQRNLE